MRISYRVLCLLAVLILAAPVAAVPATALAQSAGDDQYVDPFQDDQTGKNDNNGGGGNSGSQSDNGTSSSGSQQSNDGTDSGATAGTTAAAQGSEDANGKLPRTGGGVPEGWIVAVGVLLLLGGGYALRRVWPRPH